jgi:hypothetical protein
MAFADPQSLTISGSAVSLPRTSSGVREGQFNAGDGLTTLRVRHTSGNKRKRHTIRVDVAKIAADPLLAGVNVKASLAAGLWIDRPETGYTVAEAKAVADALLAYLSASTGAKVSQLLGDEN